MLIEVIISAMLLGLVVVGTLNGFDVSQRVTTQERSRSQADALAQQDEERLRGLSVATLSGLEETRTVKVKETTFTIESSGQFINDKTGTSSCSGSGGSADYLETVSEVSWPALKSGKKVIETGLVAPPAGGELVTTIEDGRGGFTSGMNVSLSGTGSGSATTGTTGCVVFGPLEEGAYSVTASQAGYVNEEGESEPALNVRSASVTGQTTATKSFVFNKAGRIAATFQTAPASLGTAQALNVIAAFPSHVRRLATGGVYTKSSITSPMTLFPFKTPYKVYAGTCEANNPESFGVAASAVPSAQLEPGETKNVTLTLPGMIVLLYPGKPGTAAQKGTPVTSPKIWIKDTDSTTGCDTESHEVKTFTTTINPAKGDLEYPGLPYGNYTVCANFTSGSTKHVLKTGIVNKNITTGTTVELYEGETGSGAPTSGSC